MEVLDVSMQSICLAEDALGASDDLAAFAGGFEWRGLAVEDVEAHLVFQLADLHGERGLADVHGFRGAAEVAVEVQGANVLELLERHGCGSVGGVKVGRNGFGLKEKMPHLPHRNED